MSPVRRSDLGNTLRTARRIADAAFGPGPDADRLVAGALLIAGAGLPFQVRGAEDVSYDLAAIYPRVVAGRADGACEGSIRGLLRVSKGRRRGDVVAFTADGMPLGERNRAGMLALLERVASDDGKGNGPRHAPERGFPEHLLQADLGVLYGPREAAGWTTSARPLTLSILGGRDPLDLRMPFDGDLDLRPATERTGNRASLRLLCDLAWVGIAELPAGTAAPDTGRLAAGTRIALPEGSSMTRANYADAAFRPIAQAILDDHLRQARRVRNWLARRVDRRVVRAISASEAPVSTYNWLRASRSKRALMDRLQAIGAFPILAGIVPGSEIDVAIGKREPLTPVLARRLGTSMAAIRSLRGVTQSDLRTGFGALVAELPGVAAIDPKRLPNAGGAVPRGEQWDALVSYAQGWRSIHKVPHGDSGEALERLRRSLAAEPSAWQRTNGGRPARGPREIDDYLSAAARHLVLPAALDLAQAPCPALQTVVQRVVERRANLVPMPAPFAPFLAGRTLRGLTATTREWHARVNAIEAELALGSVALDELSWEPLSEAFAAPGGDLRVVPLTTPSALAAEGREMSHCVASYVTKCVFEGVHILSVRRGDRSLSTIHVDLSGPPVDPYRVIQHKSENNGDPSPEAVAAVQAYVSALRDGTFAANPAAGRPREASARFRGHARALVGYDHGDPENRDRAMRLYAFALPEAERGLGHAEWAAMHGLAETLLPCIRDAVVAAYGDRERKRGIVRETSALPASHLADFLARLGLGKPR